MAFQFAQKGAVLGGKLYGDFQSTPISSGIVAGELVTFVVVLAEQAGNEINDTKISSTRAGAKSGAFFRPGPGQVFRLKRLV